MTPTRLSRMAASTGSSRDSCEALWRPGSPGLAPGAQPSRPSPCTPHQLLERMCAPTALTVLETRPRRPLLPRGSHAHLTSPSSAPRPPTPSSQAPPVLHGLHVPPQALVGPRQVQQDRHLALCRGGKGGKGGSAALARHGERGWGCGRVGPAPPGRDRAWHAGHSLPGSDLMTFRFSAGTPWPQWTWPASGAQALHSLLQVLVLGNRECGKPTWAPSFLGARTMPGRPGTPHE